MKRITALLGIGALSLALTGCQDESAGGGGAAQMQMPPAEVGFYTVAPTRLTLKTELTGRTVAAESSEVRPQVSGIVQARLFEEGSEVKAGQVLYQIDDSSYQSVYNEAEAALTSAEASLETARLKDSRYIKLEAGQGVSQQDKDDAHASYLEARAAVAEAKASLQNAKIDLDHTKVKAPISGRIGISTVTPGALVTASQTTALTTIHNMSNMYVDLPQSSSQQLKLRKLLTEGNITPVESPQVTLLLEDDSEYPLPGKLKTREVSVNENTGTVTLRAEFANPDQLLLPGMFVRAQVDQGIAEKAIVIPQQAIVRDAKGNASVMLITDDSKVKKQAVETVKSIGNSWLISSGLNEGDKVIVEGISKTAAGATVKPVDVSDQYRKQDRTETVASQPGGA